VAAPSTLVFAGALFACLLLRTADTRSRSDAAKRSGRSDGFAGANVALLVGILYMTSLFT
jgi:hypothetical protein